MERNKQVDIIATLEGIARATNYPVDELRMIWEKDDLIIEVYYVYYEDGEEWDELIGKIDLNL